MAVQQLSVKTGNPANDGPAMGPKGMPKKLQPGWSKEPTVESLKGDYDAAKSSQSAQMTKIQKWRDLLEVKGTMAPKKIKGRSSVQPKLVRRQAEWRYSALSEPLLNNAKLFQVNPVTFEDAAKAKQSELLLNYQFRTQLNRVKLVDEIVRALVDEGTAIAKVGWDRVIRKVKKESPVFEMYPIQDESEMEALQQAIQLQQTDPRSFDEQTDPAMKEAVKFFNESQMPTVAIQTGTEWVDSDEVVTNRPIVEVLNPDNVIIDPSCNGDIDKAMFVVVTFETCYADLVKKKDLYKNLDYVDWEGATTISSPDHATSTPTDFQFKDKARKRVAAYEYWGYADINGDGVLVPIVATWIGNVMIRLQESPFPDGKLPFVVMPYLPVKRQVFGEADAEVLEDNQKILGAITRGLVDSFGRSANAQQGFAKGMLDPINRRRFEEGKDYEFNPNANPATNLIEHKFPDIPQSAMLMLNLQNSDAESLTGTKSFAGGLSGDAYGSVATGIRGALDASAKREMSILRRLADGFKKIGIKILAMDAEFLSDKEVIRVTNKEFVEVFRDDVIGNFDLIVDISTAEIDASKAQDLAFILQTVGPNTDMQVSMQILASIVELKNMPDLAEKLRTWQPPPPSPEDIQLKQLEVAKLQAEVQKLQAETNLAMAQSRLAGAKSDKENLDFVNDQSGTSHAREMEKQQAQAEGNQALEVTKALGKPKKEGESNPNVEAMVGFNQLSKATSGQSSLPPSNLY